MITLARAVKGRCQSRARCSLGTGGCQNRTRVSGWGCLLRGCLGTCI